MLKNIELQTLQQPWTQRCPNCHFHSWPSKDVKNKPCQIPMPMRWQHVGSLDSWQVGWHDPGLVNSTFWWVKTKVGEVIAGNASVLSSSLITCAACSSDTPSLKNTPITGWWWLMASTWSESYYFTHLNSLEITHDPTCKPLCLGEVLWHHRVRSPKSCNNGIGTMMHNVYASWQVSTNLECNPKDP